MRRPLELRAWMAIFFMKGTFKITSVVSPVHPCQTTEYFILRMMGNVSTMKRIYQLMSSYRQRLGRLTERRLVMLMYTHKFTTLRQPGVTWCCQHFLCSGPQYCVYCHSSADPRSKAHLLLRAAPRQTLNVLVPVSSAIPCLANSSWNSCWQKNIRWVYKGSWYL